MLSFGVSMTLMLNLTYLLPEQCICCQYKKINTLYATTTKITFVSLQGCQGGGDVLFFVRQLARALIQLSEITQHTHIRQETGALLVLTRYEMKYY